jgi:serine/threonine protein kinase
MQASRHILNERYELIKRAGTGGMSTVYQGRDLMLGRTVAIKVLHQSLTNDEEFLHRFQKEAHAAANLSHPNIVTVHDIGQDDRWYYIVMEYVEGWTLKDLIRRQYAENDKPFPIDIILDTMIQICAGVGYAHRANLIHCDIKSQNVLVAQDRRVKVTDFGIARALTEWSIHDADGVWGTPQYFSPEQAAGEAPTPASDVYSIGIIMFEMFTGRLPFDADSHTALAVKHMRQTPPLASSFNPLVPNQVDMIIAKVLSKEPSGRYRTADQLGRVLTTYRQSSLEETGFVPLDQTERPDMVDMETVYRRPTIEQTFRAGALATKADFYPNQTRQSNSGSESYFPIQDQNDGIDWTAVVLSIIALLSLLGLIPLWYLVYLRFNG